METPSEANLLFQFTSGPRDARVVLVGEAWGTNEAFARSPFVGASGKELDRMLSEAGLDRKSILCTNVLPEQPPNNDFSHFVFTNDEVKKGIGKDGEYHGIYPQPRLSVGIERLWRLLDLVNPDLVIAAGNIPLHVLTSCCSVSTVSSKPTHTHAKRSVKLPAGITSWRGSQTWSRQREARPTYRVLPIIHPAAIIREWSFRSITVHDLRSRASRFLSGTLDWESPPTNSIWRPNFPIVETILNTLVARALHGELLLSVDIETYKQKFVSCIGLADETLELCIPFFFFEGEQRQCKSYWSLNEEQYIWERLKYLLELPSVRIIGQNFIYDSQFLERCYNINALVSLDTMVMHHLLFPGTKKALHILASLYCHHYCYWKDESSEWDADATSAEDLWRYNCKDTRATYECALLLRNLINSRPGYATHYDWRCREWRMARTMSIEGTKDDSELRQEFQLSCRDQSDKLEKWLMDCVPAALQRSSTGTPWYNSATATMDLLYTRLGISPVSHKKTKRPTSDDSAINELLERKNCEWLRPVLERISALRTLGVFQSHFLDIKKAADGRLRTQFNIAHPETFRWSSMSNPFDEGGNLQNLPKVEVD